VTDAALAGAALSTATGLEEHQFCSATRATFATQIAPWGPWSPDIDAGEQRCQLRELCADVEISVRRDGRYWSVTGQRPRRGVAA
jgi:hypothetical protein